MNYLLWSVLAMVSYSFVFLFAKLAMRDGSLSSFSVMTVSVLIVALVTVLATALTGQWQVDAYTSRSALYMYGSGVALALAVVGYFTALETGPASIVVPIYGMFIVGGSLLGILVLNEPVTARKLVGIVLAVGAVFLIAS